MDEARTPRRMEIWYADLPLRMDSCVQGGNRPVIIVSNDVCNEVNTVITIVPLTRQMKKLTLPTHAVIDAPDGLQSVVLAEQIMTIDKNRLEDRLGRIREHDLEKVKTAILEQLGMKGEQDE